jgi:hypothetical protein
MAKSTKPKGKKTGPKTNWKMTDEAIRKLGEAFAIDATIAEACFYANISIDTYHRWVKENPKLSDQFERLRQTPILKARETVAKSLDNVTDAKWYLERKRKGEFSPRVETENTHKVETIEQIEKSLKSIGSKNPPGTAEPIEGDCEDVVQG